MSVLPGTREPGYRPGAWDVGVAVGSARVAAGLRGRVAAGASTGKAGASRLTARGVRLETCVHLASPRSCGPRGLSLLFVLFASGAALAQSEVVVTGSREPLAPERLAADVAVIGQEAIRAGSADSLVDLLRREAGVQMSRNGGPGHASGVMLRGTGSSQSIVLVDGVRIGSATLGFASLESLGLAQIERVEVLRGPGSSLYGADAVGGVVNVVTRRGEPGLQIDGRVAVGGYGSREASASIGSAAGAWDGSATLTSERSQGVSALRPGDAFGNYNPDLDGYKLAAANASLGFKPAPGHRIGLTLLGSKLDSQYDGSEYLPPTYAQDASADFRNQLTTRTALLDWRGALAADIGGRVHVSRSLDDSVDGGSQPGHFRTTRKLAGAQLAWQTGSVGQLVLALEGSQDHAQSSSYVGDVERRNTALVTELTGSALAWSWQGDVRHDDSSDFGGVTTGRLGGAVTLMPGLRLRALAGTTFRAPSFNDLYFPGYGVPSLQPERGRSAEMGITWRPTAGEVSATVYDNPVRGLIGYQSDRSQCPPDPSYNYGCAANVARAQIQGATFAASGKFGAWALKAQFDLLRARDEATGERLPRRASHQGSVGADWVTGDWTLGARGLYVGDRPDGGKLLAAETTLDLLATWRVAAGWALQAKLVNATHADLEPARDYQGLGRQGWLTLRYSL